MTVTDQIKILDRKIMQNEAQYDLDRKATKISALSSNNLDKYENLTGEDLGLKPSTVEQTKFEYSPLCRVFNKGLEKKKRKKGLLKRLKILKAKIKNSYKQLKIKKIKLNAIKNIKTGSTSLKAINFFSELSHEARQLMNEIKEEENDIDSQNLVCVRRDGTIFNFSTFKLSFKLASSIYHGKITLAEAKKDQYKMLKLLKDLEK